MMFTSNRRIILFVAAVSLVLAGLWLADYAGSQSDWRTYQRRYFAQTGQPAQIKIRAVTPRLSGQPELCLTCHLGLTEISSSHPVETFGCVRCHGGNGLALDAAHAHEGMRGGKNPADLAVAEESCGGADCHGNQPQTDKNHVDHVRQSLQATYAGGIASVRYAFGAQANETPIYGVFGVTDSSPADQLLPALLPFPIQSDHPVDAQFAQNCLESGCHLTAPARAEPYFYRSTGCAACHVLYAADGLYRGNDPTLAHNEPGRAQEHQFTIAIPYSQCNHCHNRGNYSLRQMAFLLRDDIPPAGKAISAQMPAEGRRLLEYYQPVGTFTLCEWELDCVDCHTAGEIMGDGNIHPDKKEMQYTQCQTCHGTLTTPPQTVTVTEAHQTALRTALLNPNYTLEVGERVIITERGELMGNVKVQDGNYTLISKVTGQAIPFKPVLGSACEQNPAEQESRYCHQCHAYQR